MNLAELIEGLQNFKHHIKGIAEGNVTITERTTTQKTVGQYITIDYTCPTCCTEKKHSLYIGTKKAED